MSPSEYVYNTPSCKIVQSSVVAIKNIKGNWKIGESESAGASKTTLST